MVPEIPLKVDFKKNTVRHQELARPRRFHQRFQPQAPLGLAVGGYLIGVKRSEEIKEGEEYLLVLQGGSII